MAFIPVAESTGLIVSLGQWVLQTACRQAKSWMDAGITPVRIAVNFSGLQFKTPLELEGNIAAALLASASPPRLLEIVAGETLTPHLGEPLDVAHAVAFLASDEARYLTGHNLVVDGGTVAHVPGFAQFCNLFEQH